MITGGDQARLGFIDHSKGIEPRICTRDATFCFEVEESAYTIICSVSTKLAAFPSRSSPRVINLLPGLLQSFLDTSMKSIFVRLRVGELIKTYPKIQGTLNGVYSKA